MKINANQNISHVQTNQSLQKDKIYISQDLLSKAHVANNQPNKTAVIYDDKVVAIDNNILGGLRGEYKQDFQQYQGILIARGEAQKYIQKISDYVLKDLNVANADKNHDGMISVAESLDTRRIVDEKTGSILKPTEVLSISLVSEIKKDNSNFMSVNDIINLHMKLDKNKDGKVSIKEIKDGEPTQGTAQSAIDKLYKRLEKLQKELAKLNNKLSHADKEQSTGILEQIAVINIQILAVLDLLKKMLGG
jgi:hypothetical protein